ncbi:MAG: hypothetical protein DRO93_08940 [Candidatus Thorarchaeota archaeon]|nr:MAG: hypothetical protein DRO93_08940 [Candidatus Thorarchaeota archaeon]
MARSDLIDFHKKKKYPVRGATVAVVLAFFAIFIAAGVYSLAKLWDQYGTAVVNFLQAAGIPEVMGSNLMTVILAFGGLIVLSLVMASVASLLAKRLGGTLILIGAVFMNLITWGITIAVLYMGGFTLATIGDMWPMLLPGAFTLVMTLLLVTVFKNRLRRAGELIKLTGQVCLEEKGVFVPQLFAMAFSLISAVLYAGIILEFTPLNVLLNSQAWTIEASAAAAVGMILYLFTTIFIYNFAYATTSAVTYIYIRGRDPSLGDGVKGALSIIGGIALLSVMSVIVKIISAILRRGGSEAGGAGAVVGGIAASILEWVWMLINYFTIPAMVAENLGATDGIKRSFSLVRNNFVDVIIKETGVRWGFAVLALMFFGGFALGGALIAWVVTNDLVMTIAGAIVFMILASIPSTLVLKTFDIVYVTLLYVFIRTKAGDIRGKLAILAPMKKELNAAYRKANS